MSRPALTALPSGCGCPHPASRTTVPEQPETKPSQLWAKGILMSNTAPTARRQQRKRGDADKAVQGDEDVTHQFSQGPGTEEIHKKPRREGITRCAGLAMRMGAAPAARISRHRERGPRTWRRGTGLPAPAKEPGDPSIGPPGGTIRKQGRLRQPAAIRSGYRPAGPAEH